MLFYNANDYHAVSLAVTWAQVSCPSLQCPGVLGGAVRDVAELGLQLGFNPAAPLQVRDLWQRSTVATAQTQSWSVANLLPHDVQFLRLSPAAAA